MLDLIPMSQAQTFLAKFEGALTARDFDAVVGMFAEECYWRDLVAFTWNIKTMEGRDQVREMLASCLERAAPTTGGSRTATQLPRVPMASKRGSHSRLTWRAATA
jgi:ketosteroid isomerase-like protein